MINMFNPNPEDFDHNLFHPMGLSSPFFENYLKDENRNAIYVILQKPYLFFSKKRAPQNSLFGEERGRRGESLATDERNEIQSEVRAKAATGLLGFYPKMETDGILCALRAFNRQLSQHEYSPNQKFVHITKSFFVFSSVPK